MLSNNLQRPLANDPYRIHRMKPACDSYGCIRWALWLAFVAVVSGSPAMAQPPNSQQAEQFEKHIRPLLVRHCYECHSGGSNEVKGGLRLDFKDAVLKGGDSGPAIVPGNASESLLITAVKHDGLEMPPGKKLAESEVRELSDWIAQGAYDPRDHMPTASDVANETFEALYQSRRQWWSLQPIAQPEPPHVEKSQTLSEIDQFIVARLHDHQLNPAPPADRRTLARRAHFAITGLPPTEAELTEFLSDETPNAWDRLIDRLLASPHFGERWARHWMDVVRYTDTYGYEWDMPAKGAWRYRDYLIRAFNDDVPFDQLVREHIAGDLLEPPRINDALGINESLIGPMFYQMGEKRHGDSAEFNGIHQEMLDNKIDAFGKAFLATTVACARCHDHKLDAISQNDYYALGGLFMSARWVTNTVDLPEHNASVRAELEQIKLQLRPRLAEQWLSDIAAISAESLRAVNVAVPNRPMEDLLHVWSQLQSDQAAGKVFATSWTELAKRYADESTRRISENAAHFAAVVDFRDGIPEGWSADGEGLRTIVPRGDFVVSLAGEKAIDAILLGGLCTNSLSPRMNGALRTPWTKLIGPGQCSFEVAGGDFAARRIVVDNAFLTERQQYLNNPSPQWQMADGLGSQADRNVYIEFATKTSNPNFPPRVGLGGACSEEQAADPRSWFQLSRIVKHAAPFSPHDELTGILRLFEGVTPQSSDDVINRYRTVLSSAVTAWKDDTTNDSDVRLLNWMLTNGLLKNSATSETAALAVKDLVLQYRATEAKLNVPATVNGMADIDSPVDYRLNVRGDYDQLGESVPHGSPRLLVDVCQDASSRSGAPALERTALEAPASSENPGRQEPPPGQSVPRQEPRNKETADTEGTFDASIHNRLELAELVASPRNPLTARVYVNRIWYWMFGAGLVATTDDFGHVGDRPSHPELLDALAWRFMNEGWSTKQLIHSIVLSQTWQQSQDAAAGALEVDPTNRLLHHFPVQRLDAESLRDAMLAVSGRLDATLYGPTSNPSRLNEDDQKRLFSGPLDGLGRRSIYTKITIMEPPRFLATFNQPAPKIPTGRRDIANTPAQSLALLNDPFVTNQAEVWAAELITRPDTSIESRLQHMFSKAIGREATSAELSLWKDAARDFADAEQIPDAEMLTSGSLWQTLAHAMFNIKEFLYVR